MRVVLLWLLLSSASARAGEPFVIRCVDDRSGRGVPLVELETVNHIRSVSDSAGVIAFDEPGLMGRRVWFFVRSHGYEVPKDGFGFRGVALDTRPGGTATIELRRLNVAERLYRITGHGIYAHSVRAGLDVPLERPLLSGGVLGQDSVQAAVYGTPPRIHWFWGDTQRAAYPLGHFATAGATSPLPARGGLPPGVGIDLEYFVADDGFSRPMFRTDEPGMIWIGALTTITHPSGAQRLICHHSRMKSLAERLEHGLALFDDEAARFRPIVRFPDEAPLEPSGHVLRAESDGETYLYFANPYPLVRVRDDWESVRDLSRYEAWTRSGDGGYEWRRGGDPVDPRDPWLNPRAAGDPGSGEAIVLHRGSVRWNPWRERYVMIANQLGGESSRLGEVWYLEAPRPEGPWNRAVRIATHDRYSFYNPVHHAFLDEEDGRVIHFQGTYAATFSGNDHPTPRYDYNQIMYRLDLADPRLAPAHAQAPPP